MRFTTKKNVGKNLQEEAVLEIKERIQNVSLKVKEQSPENIKEKLLKSHQKK